MGHSYLVVTVRAANLGDAARLAELYAMSWGGPIVVGHGTAYDLTVLPTLVAVDPADQVVGALTYQVLDGALEVVSIEASPATQGTGTALLAAAVDTARSRGLRRVWLVTSNDNLDALRFYQRRGMRIVAVSPQPWTAVA